MKTNKRNSIILSKGTSRMKRLVSFLTESTLFSVTSVSTLGILFIILYIAKDAIPFFEQRGFKEFFTSTSWYPSNDPPEFGAFSIIFGSAVVTSLSALIAVPLSILSAVSISEIIPFSYRQIVKPVIEMIAAIPSVAYGFFALVVLAPILQNSGGPILSYTAWILGLPLSVMTAYTLSDLLTDRLLKKENKLVRNAAFALITGSFLIILYKIASTLKGITIQSGTNVLNVSLILAIMAIPTIVSVSEDAIQAVSRDLREGSYALGATRSETILKVVLPAAKSGITAGIILGVMRAVGETMVVWMASGNSAHIPDPWYNIVEPIRTLTATIAGDMGEADHVTGSARYHVLFAMAFFLLVFSFISNMISEWIITKSKKKRGER